MSTVAILAQGTPLAAAILAGLRFICKGSIPIGPSLLFSFSFFWGEGAGLALRNCAERGSNVERSKNNVFSYCGYCTLVRLYKK